MNKKSPLIIISLIVVFCMSFSTVVYGVGDHDTPIIPIPGNSSENQSGSGSGESGSGNEEPGSGTPVSPSGDESEDESGSGTPVNPSGDKSEDESGSSGGDWETPSVPIDSAISIKSCTIAAITNKVYTGKNITPSPAVKYGKTTLKKGTDYTLTYAANKNVGTATVTITGKGSYTGSVKKTFKILPKATTLSKVTSPKSKTVKITWKKQATQTTGYQIQYSTSAKFTAKTTKTVTVKGAKTTAKTIAKLKGKKKYYVRIRTYKTVSKVNYCSSWSAAKSVTTKK